MLVRRILETAWPVALLLAFAAAWRRGEADAASQPIAACASIQSADLSELERCSALDPQDVELLGRLGDGYRASGRADLAQAAFERALAIDPDDGQLYLRVAELMLARGNVDAARTAAAAAVRWLPGSPAAASLAARTSVADRGAGR